LGWAGEEIHKLGRGFLYSKFSPIVMIFLAIVGIIVLVGVWTTVMTYGLVTATIFFIGGAIFTYIIATTVEKPHPIVYIMPIIMAIIGYLLEHFQVFKLTPLSIRSPSSRITYMQVIGIGITELRIEHIAILVLTTLAIISVVGWYYFIKK
jgi:hypothetical protein